VIRPEATSMRTGKRVVPYPLETKRAPPSGEKTGCTNLPVWCGVRSRVRPLATSTLQRSPLPCSQRSRRTAVKRTDLPSGAQRGSISGTPLCVIWRLAPVARSTTNSSVRIRVLRPLSGRAATMAWRPSGDRSAPVIDQSRWVTRANVSVPRS
jgi:hypothetical protein